MLLNSCVGEDSWESLRPQGSILKEISPEYSLEGLMLKLKLQYFGLMRRTDSFEKTLMLGNIEGRRRRGWQRMRWFDGITDSMDEFEWIPGVGDGQRGLACCGPWGHKESDMTERLNWTELNTLFTDIVSGSHPSYHGDMGTWNFFSSQKYFSDFNLL